MPLSRFGRRHKHTFGKKKEKWDGDFRKPPKPNSYYVQEKGICRWCGKKIIENGLGGKLSREDNVTEKLDGQNLMISWRED